MVNTSGEQRQVAWHCGQKKRGALPLHHALNRAGAHLARLALASVHLSTELEVTILTVGVLEIAQSAAPQRHSLGQHIHNRMVQRVYLLQRQLIGKLCGRNPGPEQRLRGVNVAHTHHHIARQQHLLDAAAALLQRLPKRLRFKPTLQRFHTQVAQQFARDRRIFVVGPNDGTKTTRIVQTQGALRGQQIGMVVRTRVGQCGRELHPARHAQVQQQQPRRGQIQQQIFATSAHLAHR